VLHRTLLLLGLAVVLSSYAPAARAQALEAAEPLVVVQNFLAAREARDAGAAATWCAALLELQDVDGQWFIDEPATIVWLRLLMSNYTSAPVTLS